MGVLWGFIEIFSIIALFVGLFYRFSKKNKENHVKRKQGKYIAIAGLISLYISALIGSNISSSEAKTAEINDKKVTYEQLQKQISELEDNKKNLSSDISQQKSNLSDLKSQHKDIVEAVENKNNIEQQISDNKSKLEDVKIDIDTANDELKSINSKVSSAKDKLSSVKGEITAAESEPKTLGAGHYIVGEDIPEGRYKAVPVGGGSNFFVYDGGTPVVNTILGSYGEDSYVFEATYGEKIQTEASVKLIPIK